MRSARSLLTLSLAVLACSGRQPTAIVAPVTTSADATAPTDAGALASTDAPAVETPARCPERARALRDGERVEIIASEQGLREMGSDGAVLRTLSSTSAALPRYAADGRELVFLARGRSEVRRLSLETCRETRVASLPRGLGAQCGGVLTADYDPADFVQSDDGAGLTTDGRALCLHVMDRNINMMSVEVVLRVPLDGGAVTHRITTPETCETPRVAPGTPALCESAAVASRRSTEAMPYAIEGNRIVRRGARGRSTMVTAFGGSDVNVDEVSSSGRWQVFSANVAEGDTILRDLLLFDAQSGRVYPIVEGAFPSALDARAIRAINTVHEHTAVASGETTIRFLDPGERLWVAGLLVMPGERAVLVSGELAR